MKKTRRMHGAGRRRCGRMARPVLCSVLQAGLFCLAEAQPVQLVSLKLPPTHYEMARPANWVQGPVKGESLITMWAAPDARLHLYPNLNATLESPPGQGEESLLALFSQLRSIQPGLQVLESGWRQINGIRGHRSLSQWESIFGKLRALRFLVAWHKKVLVITFVDTAEAFPRQLPLFERCLQALAPFEEVKRRPER